MLSPEPDRSNYIFCSFTGNYDPNAFAGMPGSQILNDPMANMAMQYGSSLADQGKDYVNKNVSRFCKFCGLRTNNYIRNLNN